MKKWAFLFLLAPALGNQPLPPPEEYLLNEEQVAQVLPEPIRAELEKVLETIPWKQQQLSHSTSLAFTSAQSKTAKGGDVLNRIYYFPRKRFDVWLMKQGTHENPQAEKDWNRVVIAVDRNARPKKAYFLELAREKNTDANLPPLKAFTAACVTCHSNGPRFIRPAKEFTDPFQKKLLKTWNKKIVHDRIVANHLPFWEGESMVEWNRPGDSEILEWATCKECHSPASGVRSHLTRAQGESILFLAQNGQMPLEHPLSKDQIQCLQNWIDNPNTKQSGGGCAEKSLTDFPEEWILDPFQSSIHAVVPTSLSSFSVSHFQISGRINRDHFALNGQLKVGLGNLKTGIQLRDEHLKKLIPAMEDQEATIEIMRDSLDSFGPQKVIVKMFFRGKSKEIPAILQCEIGKIQIHCKGHLTLHLEDWGIPTPHFLGAHILGDLQAQIDLIFH